RKTEIGDQDAGRLHQLADRVERFEEVVLDLVQVVVDRVRVPDDEQRVAVGRGARRLRGADAAAGAAPVFGDDRLAEELAQRGRDRARDEIARATGRERDDQTNRLGWITLGKRKAETQDADQAAD